MNEKENKRKKIIKVKKWISKSKNLDLLIMTWQMFFVSENKNQKRENLNFPKRRKKGGNCKKFNVFIFSFMYYN
jgi:hypothetical protein